MNGSGYESSRKKDKKRGGDAFHFMLAYEICEIAVGAFSFRSQHVDKSAKIFKDFDIFGANAFRVSAPNYAEMCH